MWGGPFGSAPFDTPPARSHETIVHKIGETTSMNIRSLGVILTGVAFLHGCGGETPKPNTVTAMSAASGHEEKIKEALKKAGIKNPPSAIFDADDSTWTVVITPDGVGPNGEAPPGRPIPERCSVDKTTFEVKRQANPNQPRPGGKGGDGRVVGD